MIREMASTAPILDTIWNSSDRSLIIPIIFSMPPPCEDPPPRRHLSMCFLTFLLKTLSIIWHEIPRLISAALAAVAWLIVIFPSTILVEWLSAMIICSLPTNISYLCTIEPWWAGSSIFFIVPLTPVACRRLLIIVALSCLSLLELTYWRYLPN